MKNLMIASLLAGSFALVGCDKAEDAASKAGNAAKDAGKSVTNAAKDAGKAAADTAKGAVDAAKDAGKGAVDAAKDAGKGAMDAAKDKVTGAADAAKTTLMDSVKKEVEAVKAKIESLTKGGATVKEADKAAYTNDVEGINGEFKGLNDMWTNLSSGKAEDWKKVGEELTTKAKGLMEKVNAAMTKYGIK